MKVTEQKRLALIEAAKDEFIEFGFNAANMDRVCEKASTSKRTLYRHFESKELLFTAAINAMVEKQKEKKSTPLLYIKLMWRWTRSSKRTCSAK